MSLYQVSSGQTINSADLNQLVNTLQAPSGAQEIGKYHLTFDAYTSGAQGSVYIPTRSRGAIPASLTIDTADNAPTNCAAPSTNWLSSAGFQIFSASTGTALACNCGGNWTVQY